MSNDGLQKRLIAARELIGANRKDFAEMLQMSYRTITNYENGSRTPGPDYLVRVADACGCTTDYLLEIVDNPHATRDENDKMIMLRDYFEALNGEGKRKLLEYAEDLISSGKYDLHK